MAWIKNIEHEKCLAVTDEVSYQPGQIVSKTLAQTRHHSLTLFAFDQGEAISTHESGGDAMVLGQKAARGVGNGALQNAAYRPISGGGVTMKVKIDRDGCIGCGLCAATCPEVFRMADDGLAEVAAAPSPDVEDGAKEAADNCPVQVIETED